MNALITDLPDTGHIAQGTQAVGSAHGDLVIGHAQFLPHAVHLIVDVLVIVGIHKAHVGAQQVLQQHIALPVRDAPFF